MEIVQLVSLDTENPVINWRENVRVIYYVK